MASCFATMHQAGIDYQETIEALELKAKVKKGAGFANKKQKGEEVVVKGSCS